MGKKLYKISLVAFILFWTVFVLLDFWQHHPNYKQIVELFQYRDLYIVLSLLCVGMYFLFFRFPAAKKSLKFLGTGLGIYGLGLLTVLITLFFYNIKALPSGTITPAGMVNFLGKIFYTSLAVFFILTGCYSWGSLLNSKLFKGKKDNILVQGVDIATGIMITVLLCFLVAAIGIFHWWSVLPILLLPIILNYKGSFLFVKNCTVTPLKLKKNFNFLGFASLFFLLFFTAMNFVQLLGPMPLGWDSMTLYANLPNLMDDYDALVKGFQPYNWSIFMAIGNVLFFSTETMLALSYIGGILSLFLLFGIARHYFKTDINFCFLGLLLFYCIPTIGLQSFLELKIDLGLLFIILATVVLFLDWAQIEKKRGNLYDTVSDNSIVANLSTKESTITETVETEVPKKVKTGKESKSKSVKSNKTTSKKSNSKKPANKILFHNAENGQLFNYAILIGLLSGFAFGIKLTTLFSFFTMIAAMWYVSFGNRAFIGTFLVAVGMTLVVKMDDISGLRSSHLTVDILQWVLIALGLALFASSVYTNRDRLFKSIKITVLLVTFFTIAFTPWMAKNLVEAGELNANVLLKAESDGPELVIKDFIARLKEWKKEGN